MGRDIVAYCAADGSVWDNYQCKHYKNPLAPSDVWVELGKLAFYTYRGDYTYPRRYIFVAPLGAGTSLSNLFRNPTRLRTELFKNWNAHCRTHITSTRAIELDDEFRRYIETLDFAIYEAIPPLRLIDQHAKTRWHVARFGGGLPARQPAVIPPAEPAGSEANYVRQLLDAYADHLNRPIQTVSDLETSRSLREHFDDCRMEFYSAESLREFSRDTLPPGSFEALQDEIHSGIRDECRSAHQDGYDRVVSVVKTARSLQITAHALVSRFTVRDRGGVCHELANDLKVR
jgi:hypothetical protein